MAIEIAPGILVLETSRVEGKVGVVAGRREALAVDAGLNEAEGAELAEAVRSTGHAPVRLAYTHPHDDHVLGGGAFRGGEIFAREECATAILVQAPTWAAAAGRTVDEFRASLGLPTVRYTGDLTIDLGGREVRLISAPGHAPGTVIALVPDAGVLFGGDTVVTNIPPAFMDGNSGQMEATLRQLADIDVDILVPGHGPIVRGRAAIRETILWMADYLAASRAHVAGLLGRASTDDIVASAHYEGFIGDRFDTSRHRMLWRHENTIRTIVAEHQRAAS